jgi:histidyl-tRNA synthetase
LIGLFLGEEIPATGASLGLERLVEVVDEYGLLPTPASVTEVLVISVEADHRAQALRIARELRQAGLDTEVYLGERIDLRRQLQYADRKGVPVAVIIGPDEIANDMVTVRDLRTGEQVRVPRAELVAAVRKPLGAARQGERGSADE